MRPCLIHGICALIPLMPSNEGLRLYPAVPSGSHRAPEVGKGGRAVGP